MCKVIVFEQLTLCANVVYGCISHVWSCKLLIAISKNQR